METERYIRQRDDDKMKWTRWGPYTNMHDLGDAGPLVIDRAEGIYVWDESGRQYLDAHAGLWLANIGYGRKEVIDAIVRQADRLSWFSSFGGFANRPSLELADRLVDLLTPDGMGTVFFSNDGSEAMETALKIARQYWKMRGQGAKVKLIGRQHAYHGVTLGALSVAGITPNRRLFEPLLEGVRHAPAPYVNHCAFHPGVSVCNGSCAREVERIIRFEGPETVAAFVAEPVQAAGGVIIPPPGYLAEVQEICRRLDVLFIADEVVTGFGRMGTWTGSRFYGITPDLMTFAKGVTSGYLPLGVTAAAPHIIETFLAASADGPEFRHGNTYSGHPLSSAAALANIAVMEREGLVEHAAEMAPYLKAALETLASAFPGRVIDAGAAGLLGRVELAAGEQPGQAGARVAQHMLAHGVIVRPVGDVITLSPPLIIRRPELDVVVNALGDAIRDLNLVGGR